MLATIPSTDHKTDDFCSNDFEYLDIEIELLKKISLDSYEHFLNKIFFGLGSYVYQSEILK